MSIINHTHREKFAQYLRNELIGPGPFLKNDSEDNNVLEGINPIDRFPCGVIYPINGEDQSEEMEDVANLSQTNDDDSQKDDRVFVRRHLPPSSFGMSFYIKPLSKDKAITLSINCHAVIYQDVRKDRAQSSRFQRIPLEDAAIKLYEPQNSNSDQSDYIIWDERARLHAVWRSNKNGGYLVTLSLVNKQKMSKQYNNATAFTKDRAEKSLFEAHLEANIESGILMDYPEADLAFIDEGQQEIQLQYSSHKIYAIGHNTSVTWKETEDGVKYLCTDSMPTVEVPMLVANNPGERKIFRMEFLESAPKNQIIEGLTEFIDDYQTWRDHLDDEIASYNSDDQKIANRITSKIDLVIKRMHTGVALLSNDENALKAFRYMNQAIYEQGKNKGISSWRPFQLGFILTTIESIANENSDFRDTVDLIWFPTGGGKTEAYLGLVAFLITLRRLQFPESAIGTTIIMRYTLRLLTRDQFLRATKVIFALELIRRQNPELGKTPFSIGMWVGSATSPNTCYEATQKIEEAIDKSSEPPLVIDRCPYCETKFSLKKGNYEYSEHDFHFYCKNPNCPFGKTSEPLPCNVVDEMLYDDPPTFLVGTVDKFARLAWEPKASAFFGKDSHIRPPELIIQDELHLISSALGSIVGVYEAGIDTILQYKNIYPKYIASTATIRSADSQIKSLFGRDVAIYPAQGLSADDSYFAKTVPLEKRPGRLYIGYYAPLLGQQESFAPLGAALLSAPPILFGDDQNAETLLDAYWTNVVYHGSLKGLSATQLSFDMDARDMLRRLIKEKYPLKDEELEPSELEIKKLLKSRTNPKVEQLDSQKNATEIQTIFNQLRIPYPNKKCLDAVLSTNMISVGLDVDRLALMVVNGQPLTTAEYIQASSRVGRADVPGIVITNYYRGIARNIAHYEFFRSYHESFYSFVEPSSVTPWTHQARDRALHAAYVIAIRHCLPELRNDAFDFSIDTDPVRKVTKIFKKRCRAAAGDLKDATSDHIDKIISQWQSQIDYCENEHRKLVYNNDKEKSDETLLYDYDAKIRGLWPTLQSMRNVEDSGLIKELP